METLDKLLDIAPVIEEGEILGQETPTVTTSNVVVGSIVSIEQAGYVAEANTPAPADTPAVPKTEKELEDDFQHVRVVVKDGIDKARPALDSAILLAQSGDSPRAYEVVGKMLENIVAAGQALVELHKQKKDILAPPPQKNQSLLPSDATPTEGSTVNIDKAVFVGRASDLLREIKQIANGLTNASES